MSRFFLRSEEAHRDMWFVHYSKVMRSRLVMNDSHWLIGNASVTQGDAGLDMIGFRPDWEDQIEIDFDFEDKNERQLLAALSKDVPELLGQYDVDAAPTVGEMLNFSADATAATEDQWKRALGSLEAEGVIDVLTPSGGRKRPSARLQHHHRIKLPRQTQFYF